MAIVAAATAATYVYFDSKPRVYESSTRIFVQSSAIDQAVTSSGVTLTNSARVTANQAQLISTRSVAENVARRINFAGDPGALLGSVNVKSSEDTDFVTITARAGSPRSAALRANAFARAFSDVRSASNRKRLQEALTQARAELSSLPRGGEATSAAREEASARVRQLEAVTALPAGGAQVTDQAQPSGSPIEPHPIKSAIFALLLSLLLAVGLAFVIDLFDRRIKGIEDIESTYPFPILAVVPQEADITPVHEGALAFGHHMRESFRSLRTSIGLTSLDRSTKTILVTSAVAAEGKSTIVRNLAIAYAEAGLRVVVIETDLRRPSLSSTFGVNRQPGLTDVVAGLETIETAMQHATIEAPSRSVIPALAGSSSNDIVAPQPELSILTSGPTPPNPPGVLAAQRTHQLIEEVGRDADVVLIDSPPLLAVSDAVPLLSQADAVIVVARLNHSTAIAGKRLVELLGMVPESHIAGVVVNGVEASRLQESGLEYYYYGHYYGPDA